MTTHRSLSPEDEALATRYVLGELSEAEFSDFEARYSADAAFRDKYNAWAAALDNEPSPVSQPLRDGFWQSFRERLDAWGVADLLGKLGVIPAVVGALIAALLVVFVTNLGVLGQAEPVTEGETLLHAEDGAAVATATLNEDETLIEVTVGSLRPDENRVFEFWLVGEAGVPVSLGILATSEGSTAVSVPEDLRSALIQGALVITEEPLGGAGDAGPTGPIIAAGAFAVAG